MFSVTVVLEHPTFAHLSSVVFQETSLDKPRALKLYRELCDIYIDRQYSVVCGAKPFSLEYHSEILAGMREEKI